MTFDELRAIVTAVLMAAYNMNELTFDDAPEQKATNAEKDADALLAKMNYRPSMFERMATAPEGLKVDELYQDPADTG